MGSSGRFIQGYIWLVLVTVGMFLFYNFVEIPGVEGQGNVSEKASALSTTKDGTVGAAYPLENTELHPTEVSPLLRNSAREEAIQCLVNLQNSTRELFGRLFETAPNLFSVRFTKKGSLQLLFNLKFVAVKHASHTHQPWVCDNRTLAKLWNPDPHSHTLIMECPADATFVFSPAYNLTYNLTEYVACEKLSPALFPSSSPSSGQPPDMVACTMVSDYNYWLVPQWVEYNRLVGFDQVWIYWNSPWDSVTNHKRLSNYLEREDVQKYMTLIPFDWQQQRDFYGQMIQQNDCLALARRMNVRWAFLGDVDEFIQVRDSNKTLTEVIEPYEAQGGVSLPNWFFGNFNKTEAIEEPLLMKEYPYAAETKSGGRTKVLVRPENVEHFSVHMITSGRTPHFSDPLQEIRMAHFKQPHLGKFETIHHDSSLSDKFAEQLEQRLQKVFPKSNKTVQREDPDKVAFDMSSQLGIRHECPAPPKASNMFVIIGNALRVLNSMDCPYNIHSGTMLNFVRDCVLNGNDFDLAIPLVWMQTNEERLKKALEDIGFGLRNNFGEPNQFGHELKFVKDGFKLGVFTSLEHNDFYEWALWTNNSPTRCVLKRTGVEEFQWGSLTLRVPVPFENVLRSLYGFDWRKPAERWHWYKSAVEIGSCVPPNEDKRLEEIMWPFRNNSAGAF